MPLRSGVGGMGGAIFYPPHLAQARLQRRAKYWFSSDLVRALALRAPPLPPTWPRTAHPLQNSAKNSKTLQNDGAPTRFFSFRKQRAIRLPRNTPKCSKYAPKRSQIDKTNQHQLGEVSKIGWYSFDKLKDSMLRKYSVHKITCLTNVFNTLLKNFNDRIE